MAVADGDDGHVGEGVAQLTVAGREATRAWPRVGFRLFLCPVLLKQSDDFGGSDAWESEPPGTSEGTVDRAADKGGGMDTCSGLIGD